MVRYPLLVAALLASGCSSPEPVPLPESDYTFAVEDDLVGHEVAITMAGVPPGGEGTSCVDVRVDNPESAFVRRFRAMLTDGSHHMIVYHSIATEERLEPYECDSFSGLFDGDHPVFIAQQHDATLLFPTDGGVPVALEIAAGQMLRLELHYINTAGEPADITGTLALDTLPPGREVIPSDLAFWGTTNLNGGGNPSSEYIPAGAKGDTGLMFQRGLAGTKSFAATTHQHRLGTRMRIWSAQRDALDALGDAELVVDGLDWEDPPLALLDPPVIFADEGGTFSEQVLAYRCEYDNTTGQDVYFGEGFYDEMCFLWHYYYPSQGFQICMSGLCLDTWDL